MTTQWFRTFGHLGLGSLLLAAIGGLSLLGCTGELIQGPSDKPVVPNSDQPTVAEALETPRFARLSHQQWTNTLQDLLRLPGPPSVTLSSDTIVHGFDNAANQLKVSANLRIDYEGAAEKLAAEVARDAQALARIMPANLPDEALAKARTFIETFGLRAFRRPLEAREVERYVALFESALQAKQAEADPFSAAVEILLRAFLQSPHFLYRTELGTGDGKSLIRLTAYETASKLSYALVNRMPDEELFAAAERGELGDRQAIGAQARRLLEGPQAASALDSFHRQHFGLASYRNIEKATDEYPEFTPTLAASMEREALLFLAEVVNGGGGVADTLRAPYTFVNAELAPLYGLTGNFDDSFQRVELPPGERAGFLTQVGFLANFSEGGFPLPILRGLFINEHILCRDLPAPVSADDVLAAVNANPRMEGQTNRQYFDSLTGEGTCGAACHVVTINPPGYALEAYDGLGRYRTTDNGAPVDASGSFPITDRTLDFSDGVDFAQQLAEAPQVHSCMSQAWVSRLLGIAAVDRTTETFLEALGKQYGDRSAQGNLSIKDLIIEIVTSDHFLTRQH